MALEWPYAAHLSRTTVHSRLLLFLRYSPNLSTASTRICMSPQMTFTDGITIVGPSVTSLASYIPNHTPPVTHYRCPEIGLVNASRTSNRAHNNHTLPIEILVHIFTLASAASLSIFDVENQALWNGRLTLATVVSVCRLWRIAALGAQSLWSTIVLPSGSKHIQKCLELSLYYSSQSLIDIFFFRFPGRQVYDDDTQKAREHDKILDTLSHNDVSSRLRTLSNIPVGSMALNRPRIRREMGDLLRNINQTIQAVGILHWEHSTGRDSTRRLSLSTIIDILKCLPDDVRQLSLQPAGHRNGVIQLFAVPKLRDLWNRLSHLSMSGPSFICLVGATKILRECPVLEECQLSSVNGLYTQRDDLYGPLFGKERVILPLLRQLVIQSFDGDATYLLDAISCPSIVNLAVKQNTVISSEREDHDAMMRWESFIQRSFSMSPSPQDILHEIWVHGLPTNSIDYLLSSRAVKNVHSIALARRGYTLSYPGRPELPQYDIPAVPPLNMHDVYIEAAEEYGLLVTDMLKDYETVPWYGWNNSVTPLRLSAFVLQCLEKANTFVDTPTRFDAPTIVDLD